MSQVESGFEECLRRIERLPHADVIRREDAIRWTRKTIDADPDRAYWHVARAGGVGGSEAGAMLAWAFGGFNARESVERLAKRKLLVIPPDAPNFDTGRGHYLETHIRQVYEERLTREGRIWRHRDDLKAIVEGGPHPEMPWMRASLDGLYEIDGRIVVTDFKAPSEESLTSYVKHGDYHEYRAQLNHYALVAEGRGVRVDALELAFYDYRRVSTEGVRVRPIEIDRELQDRLAQACDSFWNGHVAMGKIPVEDRERRLRHPDVPSHIEAAARRAVDAKILSDRFQEDYEDNRTTVSRWVSVTGKLGDGMLALGSLAEGAPGFLEMRARRELDVDAAVARLRFLGMDENAIDDLRLPPALNSKKAVACYGEALRLLRAVFSALETGGDMAGTAERIGGLLAGVPGKERSGYDPDLVSSALVSCGEVPYHYEVERVAGTLPRGTPPDLVERRDLLARMGDGLLDSIVTCNQEAEELHEETLTGASPGF